MQALQVFLCVSEAGLFALSGYGVYRCGGLRGNLPFSFALLLYFFYTLFNPALNGWLGRHTLNGINYANYIVPGLCIYVAGLSAFSAAYFLTKTRASPFALPQAFNLPLPSAERHRLLTIIFWSAYSLMLLNAWLGGRNLLQLLNFSNPERALLLYRTGRWSAWLETSCHVLIALLILASVYKVKRGIQAWWLLLTGLIFVFTGLRYRVLMVLIGLFGNGLLSVTYSRRAVWRLGLALLLAGGAFYWYSLNRWAIGRRQWEYITFNPFPPDGRGLLTETNNSQVFFCVLKYQAEQNLGPDWGESMLGFVGVRLLPKQLFPDGKKPLPGYITLIRSASRPPNPGRGMGALTNMEEYYTAFGYGGVLVFMGLLGYLLARLPSGVYLQEAYGQQNERAVQVLVTAFLFQLVTRGWFPQQLELGCFMAATLWLANLRLPRRLQP